MEYQNIFTQVQVEGPPEWGMDTESGIAKERGFKPSSAALSAGWATPSWARSISG